MSRREFYNYILDNFNISIEAARLVNNILCYIETYYTNENEQYSALCHLLGGAFGLTDHELKKVYF